MEYRFCKFCNIEHPLDAEWWYFRASGSPTCKKRHADLMLKRYQLKKDEHNSKGRQYKQDNKEKVKLQNHDYYIRNKDIVGAKTKAYAEADPELARDRKRAARAAKSEYYRAKAKEFYKTNKENIFEKRRQRLAANINARLAACLRSRIGKAIKNGCKGGSAVKDLGCSIEEFRKHLESKFKLGMTWDNYSFKGWHIDHIRPLCSFDLSDRDQFLKACHYTNMQPLWAVENLSKNKYEEARQCLA